MNYLPSIITFLFYMIIQFVFSFFFDFYWFAFIMITMIISSLAFYYTPLSKSTINTLAFVSVLILWIGYTYYINDRNNSILLERIATLFHLPNGLLLIPIIGIFGGLLSLFASYVVLLFFTTKKITFSTPLDQ